MKKNAILALIMAASMTIAMTSCGTADEEVSNGTEQPSYNEAMGIDEAVTEAKEEIVIEPAKEILDAELADNKIQLGNKVYKLPVTLQTLLDDGAVILDNTSPVNDIVQTRQSVELSIDDIKYQLYFSNENEEATQIKDCFAEEAGFDSAIPYNVIFAKGIKIGSTIDELKAAWGEPTENNLNSLRYIDYDKHKYIKDGYDMLIESYQYTVSLDLENNVVTDIDFIMNYDFYSGKYNIIDINESTETSAEESIETSAIDE